MRHRERKYRLEAGGALVAAQNTTWTPSSQTRSIEFPCVSHFYYPAPPTGDIAGIAEGPQVSGIGRESHDPQALQCHYGGVPVPTRFAQR
jgi:hypothetical protein